MSRLIKISKKQLDDCILLSKKLTFFEKAFFHRDRSFAFYGDLDISEDGWISLHNFFAACSSGFGSTQDLKKAVDLVKEMKSSKWNVHQLEENNFVATLGEFGLSLITTESKEGRHVSHLFLSRGMTDKYRNIYLEQYHSLSKDEWPAWVYYKIGEDYEPDKAEEIEVEELATRLIGKKIIALVGAGVSRASDIPTLYGPGSLDENIPLNEPFPGELADWMIAQPYDLQELIGKYQALLIAAKPNPAHFALAQLEKMGVVLYIMTGNKDCLCEKAGCINVHLCDDMSFFLNSGEGWKWIQTCDVMLISGISRDEHGLLSYARDHGLQIVAIAPKRLPFLYSADIYVEGYVEDILPRIKEALARKS